LVVFAILIALGAEVEFGQFYTTIAFLIGGFTSIVAGYIGMRIATYTNVRTTYECADDIHKGFVVAYRGGQVLGFCLVGLALLILQIIIIIYKAMYLSSRKYGPVIPNKPVDEKGNPIKELFETVSGYGLGGSTVALFGRVGGGIYTKAADVGSDLAGKNVQGLPEDSPDNPGVIADNVGDNVGDIAGMGADLFGSLAESTCAALVVGATSDDLIQRTDAIYFPLLITAVGIIASFITTFLATNVGRVTKENVERTVKIQLIVSTILMCLITIPIVFVLPDEFHFYDVFGTPIITCTRWKAFGCVNFGLWSGLIIGYVTEVYTSNAYSPVQNLAEACCMGAAPNIILGLALGYFSCIIPIFCIALTIYGSFIFGGMYGVSLSALGMLGCLPIALAIDGYGPISDNAGGIAEMAGLHESVREKTDKLDAAGNTTAAIGKGFAIGSACLVSLALFGAFCTRAQLPGLNVLSAIEFSSLLIGAMLPYAFSAFTMQAVGDAANEMIAEITEQFADGKIRAGLKKPNYDSCIAISTKASLKKMIIPGLMVIGSPLILGALFGPNAVGGLLAGCIVSGVQIAFSFSNTGGAWDNAKKYVEAGIHTTKTYIDPETKNKVLMKKKTECHQAAVTGDTVGDPLKDTSGPAINILIKLSAITSLVFGSFFNKHHAFNMSG
jgi:H+-translocating diphosphatase